MARVLLQALEPVALPQLRVRLLQVCVSTPRHHFAIRCCAQESYCSVADGYGAQVLNRLLVVFSTSLSLRDLSV